MKSKSIALGVIISILTVILTLAACVGVRHDPAQATVSVMSVSQSQKVVYCALSYIDETGSFVDMGKGSFRNDLYSALEFYLDGNKVSVDHDDVHFTDLQFASEPNVYTAHAAVTYADEDYNVPITFTISKRKLIVRALVNGQTSATVKEGEKYTTSVEYEGFVGFDNVNALTAPAYIAKEPKMPTAGYDIVPEYGQSDLYEFEYQAARIVITAAPLSQMAYAEGGVPILLLQGSFSPYYKVDYADIAISKANSSYVALDEKIEKYYGSNGLLDKYEARKAFRINVYLDDENAELSSPTTVNLKVNDKLAGKKEYILVQFATDGTNNVISASVNNGYLTFTTVNMGEYVLFTPIEGVNKVAIIGIVVGIILVAALGIIFGSLFRRKY